MTTDTQANVVWQPNKGPQTEFLADPCDWVLYGGAAGGGKSDALLADALGQINDPAYQAILFRKSYPDLEELIARSKDFYPACGGRWNKTEKTWTFPSGAIIKFRYIERDDDVRNYQGHAYQWIGWDECTHFTEFQWWYMSSRNRPRREGQRCYMRASCNPDGPGLQWVKSLFVDAAPWGQVITRRITDPVTGAIVVKRQRFIPARLSDNPILAATGYGATLAMLPEAERKALLDGDWNAFTGSVFKLVPGVHVWTWEQFKQRAVGNDHGPDDLDELGIPHDWPRFRVMDWGYAKPFAVLWLAVDYDGRGYLYREWYGVAEDSNGNLRADVGVSLQPTVTARQLRQIEANERISEAWTGPDLDSAGTGDTTAGIKRIEYFQREGIDFAAWTAGPNSRKAKMTALHERLWYATDADGNVTQWPGLIVLDGPRQPLPSGYGQLHLGGRHVIRTVPALEYDPNKGGEDVNTKMEDHAYDALAGWCLMRPWSAKRKPTELQEYRRLTKRPPGWMSR